jgi:hypothetical protein
MRRPFLPFGVGSVDGDGDVLNGSEWFWPEKPAQPLFRPRSGVARWLIFEPKIPIWVNYGGPYLDRKMLIYFMAIWNIIRTFGIFYNQLEHF